jgi:aconitate hydratase
MITLHEGKHLLFTDDRIQRAENVSAETLQAAKEATLTYGILKAHNRSGNMENLDIRFDSMGVYDNTYVGILQTARASGLK